MCTMCQILIRVRLQGTFIKKPLRYNLLIGNIEIKTVLTDRTHLL